MIEAGSGTLDRGARHFADQARHQVTGQTGGRCTQAGPRALVVDPEMGRAPVTGSS